jgi:hypothetical protein
MILFKKSSTWAISKLLFEKKLTLYTIKKLLLKKKITLYAVSKLLFKVTSPTAAGAGYRYFRYYRMSAADVVCPYECSYF